MDNDLKQRQDKARQAGYSEDQIAQLSLEYVARKQAAQQPTVTPQTSTPPKKDRGFRASDLLPIAVGVAGAIGGSLLAPGVGTIIGGGAGSAAGEALRQKLEGEYDPGRVALEGGLGAVPVGKVFGLAGKGISRLAGRGAENLALRTLKPSKTQITKFSKKTGEKLEDFIVRNKLFEKGTQQVDDIIAPLQNQYDELALSTTTRVRPQQVYAGFTAKIKELQGIPTTQAKSLAGQLSQELKLVKQAWKKKTDIGMDELTNLRRQVDQLIPESKFMADPLMQGKNRYVRNIYKGVIDEATSGKTAPVGKELSKLYAYRELAEIQQQLGRGTLPVGMQHLIGAGVGAALGGGGTLAYGGSPQDALKNALIGIGFVHLANNPKVLALASKTLNKISKVGVAGQIGPTPATTTLPRQIVSQVIGQPTSRLLAAPFRGGEPTGELPVSPTDVSFAPPVEATGGELPAAPLATPGGETKEQFKQRLIDAANWDLANNQGKQLTEIKAAYDLNFGDKTKEESPYITKAMANIDDLLTNTKQLGLGPIAGGISSKSLQSFGGTGLSKETVELNQKYQLLKLNILRAYQGARISDADFKLATLYTPVITDTQQTAKTKLEVLKNILSGVPQVPTDQLPASPDQVTFP